MKGIISLWQEDVEIGSYWWIVSIIGTIYSIDGQEYTIIWVAIDAYAVEASTTSWYSKIIECYRWS